MRIARTLSISLLSAALLTVGMAVAPISQAVAPASEGPAKASAEPTRAFLRVDGGTAYATRVAKHRYTVRLPRGTDITWLGEAGGKTDQWGTFTAATLTKAWTRIGHRPGVGVQSTITWRESGASYTSFVDASVSDPRINRDGALVFTARTLRGVLPTVLPDFSFNISPAKQSTRGYPIAWSITTIGNIIGFKPSATDDTSALVEWKYDDPFLGWVACNVPSITLTPASLPAGASQANVPYNGFTCNGTTILTSASATYVAWSPMVPGGRSSMLPCWLLKLSSTKSTPGCSYTSFSWAAGATSKNP